MHRRQFLSEVSRVALGLTGSVPMLTGVSGASVGQPAGPSSRRRRPNFIFILTDDLGWGDLGCYGHRSIKTPNLDRLAEQGSLYTQFYVSSGVCSPSRTAFMTSHYPARHRVHGHFASHEQNAARGMPDFLDPAPATVTRLLQSAGYATAHFGKWHLGSGEGAPDPGAYGIDVHRTVNSNGPTFENAQDPYFRARSTRLIIDETIRFAEANRDRPFYINAWTLLPHALLHPTEEQMQPYRQFGPGGSKFPYKGAMQIYYASVSDIDAQVGRLMAKLDELGLAEDTVVAFSSDNGPEDIHIRNASHSGVGSPGPFRGRKRSLYEGGVRMPFIVRWPGHVPAERVDDSTVLGAVDWLPSVCSMAGVRAPDGVGPDGEDMSPALLGEQHERSGPLMWEWRFPIAGHTLNKSPMLSIRDGKWKLLMNPDRSRVELYDIPNDPSELTNLAGKHRNVVKRLSKQVLEWQATLPEGPVQAGAGSNAYRWPE